MTKAVAHFRPKRRQLLLVVVFAGALYVVLPQFGAFRTSWALIRHPSSGFVVAAAALTLATYCAGAATYCLLAARRLAFGRTLLVQLAAMFMNRLLPSGVGAVGANYVYLRNQQHTAAQAASIVALNNAIGFVGHGLLIGIALLLAPPHALAAISRPVSYSSLAKIFALLVLLIVAAALYWGWKPLRRLFLEVVQQLAAYRRRPQAIAGALLTSSLLTICNVLCLQCCLLALGVHLPFVITLLVFSIGVGAGIATPTPGGLGGFEAGLAAGLVASGVGPARALAGALLYRLASYWLPLVLGVAAFVLCQRYRWLNTSILGRAKHA